MSVNISPQAHIYPKAKIASTAKVEPFTTIYNDVEIGENTWIGPYVTIFDGARIGNGCKIYPGAVISPDSQDLKYQGSKTLTVIGDNTIIREFVTIHKGTEDKMATSIGSNCLIMAYAHIAHDCVVGDHVVIANNTQVAGHVIIDDWAVIEGITGVQQFTRIGKHAFVGALIVVNKDVPPYTKTAKRPNIYLGVNTIGLKRRNIPKKVIENLENIYRHIFLKGLNITNALEEVEKTFEDSPEKREVLDFIRSSKQGIIRSPLLRH